MSIKDDHQASEEGLFVHLSIVYCIIWFKTTELWSSNWAFKYHLIKTYYWQILILLINVDLDSTPWAAKLTDRLWIKNWAVYQWTLVIDDQQIHEQFCRTTTPETGIFRWCHAMPEVNSCRSVCCGVSVCVLE